MWQGCAAVDRQACRSGGRRVSLIVGVHGIGQQGKGEDILLGEWGPALRDGLRRAGEVGAEALNALGTAGLSCAFYGDLFRPPGRVLGIGDPWLGAEDATQWDAQMLEVLWAGAAACDFSVVSPDARVLARVPGGVQAALAAMSNSRFFAGIAERAMLFDLAQVRRYLTEPGMRAVVQDRVAAQVGADTKVIVGHSLGSVVAYEALCAHPEWPVTTLVTLGSPLGIPNLIFDQLVPPPAGGQLGVWPRSVLSWTNIADSGDVVALVKDLKALFGPAPQGAFEGYLVHNGSHAHAVEPYLTARQTGRAIAEGVLAGGVP